MYKKIERLRSFIHFLGLKLAILLLISLSQCTHTKENGTTADDTNGFKSSDLHELSDQNLAKSVCGGCHLFPEPALLAKKTWEKGVLPKMAMQLGFISLKNNPYESMDTEELRHVTKSAIFPGKPLIDSALWDRVVNYYLTKAPEISQLQDKKDPVNKNWVLFKPLEVQLAPAQKPTVTLVEYDSLENLWYIGNRDSRLYKLNDGFQVVDSIQLESPPADIHYNIEQEPYILTMGKMDPNDKRAGKLEVWQSAPLPGASIRTVIDSLPRPVHISVTDLNGDKLQDKIICGFGHYTGELAWYKQLANGKYQEHLLKSSAGARKTVIADINQDQKPDIIVLMAQGNEGIFSFINKGQDTFEEKTLLRFPPVYGSSDFDLMDFNQDGFIDILYTNGDNADYSASLKKYHGVRIFLNDGKNNFYQQWFYPLHGATKAIARDFDQDGDLDISTISFFPDYVQAPDEGFVYFENTGELNYKAYTFENVNLGRWLTMDVGDVDNDSDVDIVLGSFIFATTPVPDVYRQKWLEKGKDVIVLINQKFSSPITIRH